MAIAKPRIVIIGAGMAGIAAASRICKFPAATNLFDISVVEGGNRIGGRINTDEFGGDQIELGATWIHGIEGSPIYKIARESNLLHSPRPWERMDGFFEGFITVAEGGHILNPSLVEPISKLSKTLLSQGKSVDPETENQFSSVGSFFRHGFKSYQKGLKNRGREQGFGNWRVEELERAIFAMHENIERNISAVDDLGILDFKAGQEYTEFPGDHITIGRGYSSVIESMAAALPVGTIRLNQKVEKIEWCRNSKYGSVKLHFSDRSTTLADHVIVTVSLGVLKHGTEKNGNFFDPPLPSFKTDAIARLGYGVVEKVFLQLSCNNSDSSNFPYLQTVFHEPDSEFRSPEIPSWIRRLFWLNPIYRNSRVILSWFTGQDAKEVENLSDQEIIKGFDATVSNLLPPSSKLWKELGGKTIKFAQVKRSRWGADPLFLGSYSYVPVGPSGDDFDAMAVPLPDARQMQILFAGEATHRTHYSTTHGAYLSGIREANRVMQLYDLL